MNRDISHIRKMYSLGQLDEETVARDPIQQFREWFDEALESKMIEPNAMVLSTMEGQQPTSRVLLLKGFDNNGFIFFTNYNSRKGQTLSANPKASLLFFWDALERQVRIEGTVEKASKEISDGYFNSRPHSSRIGAIASPQSQRINNRDELEEKVKQLEAKYPGDATIPRPENWGGYVLNPHRIEFWQGRPNRLHDRIVYERNGNEWAVYRIAP